MIGPFRFVIPSFKCIYNTCNEIQIENSKQNTCKPRGNEFHRTIDFVCQYRNLFVPFPKDTIFAKSLLTRIFMKLCDMSLLKLSDGQLDQITGKCCFNQLWSFFKVPVFCAFTLLQGEFNLRQHHDIKKDDLSLTYFSL